MKQLLLAGAILLAFGASANAQQIGNGANNNGNGATLPLPEGVDKVVSIDAFNILLAQSNRDGKSELSPIIVRHVYSGGIARLFGGQIVPTSQFVSPGQFNGNGNNANGNNGNGNNANGNNGNGNNGIQNNGGQNSFGGGFQSGGNGGNGGLNNGGFNNGGASSFGAFAMRRFGRRN